MLWEKNQQCSWVGSTEAGGCNSRARPHCRERGGRAGRAVLRIKGQNESCGTENETEKDQPRRQREKLLEPNPSGRNCGSALLPQ